MNRPRHHTAQIIWDDIKKHGPTSSAASQSRTGLSHMQWWYGMGFLRDNLMTKNGQPLVYSPSWGEYTITPSQQEWEDYIVEWRMKSIVTQLIRIEMTAIAGGMTFPRTKRVKNLIAAITALRALAQTI
jgi:hypothetical protein